MVAIRIAHTAPINPPGATPILTHAQVWAGLARKARRPQEFVPVVERCEILSEIDDVVSAIVYFKPEVALGHGRRITETCRLSPPHRLHYEMEDGSTAENIISGGPSGDSDVSELFLTFVFEWEHPELKAGSAELEGAEETHTKVAAMAVGNTIAVMRKLAMESDA